MTHLEILKWNEKDIIRSIEKEKAKPQDILTEHYIKEFEKMLQDIRMQIKEEEDRLESLEEERMTMFEISETGKEMLHMQDVLAKEYKYKKQPPEVAAINMEKYVETIPEPFQNAVRNAKSIGLEMAGKNIPLYSKSGTLFAAKYDRIVIGHYGAFMEISPEDMVMHNVVVKKGQEYRIYDPSYAEHVKYQWFTTDDKSDCKLYYQQKGVTYADYQSGKWYVSPFEVCTVKELERYLETEEERVEEWEQEENIQYELELEI